MTQSIAIEELVYANAINYAMQQNHVPVIKKLTIKNVLDTDLYNVNITIQSEPAFTAPWHYSIGTLAAQSSLELDVIPIHVQSDFLAGLTERLSGTLVLKIYKESELLAEERRTIDILAYDQWSGLAILPEMVTAFITPNHPEINGIIHKAATILQKWTGSPSFDAYQSRNPDRVKKQMAAIYEAIAAIGILYCTVPASFEEQGQRIRLADSIFSHKMGNCLDISLLYAACLEAIGINPLVVMTTGHAFVGGWLIDESFADPVNDDFSLLTKRIASGINEIVLIEGTCMNAGMAAGFDDAINAATAHLAKIADLNLFIDVKRARFGHIRPLPLRAANASGFQVIEDLKIKAERNNDRPGDLDRTIALTDGGVPKVHKQQLWERKLLDLTLRNNLLNLRITKSTLQFIAIDPAKLEDALAEGQEFQILPKPSDWDNPLRNAGLYQSVHATDPMHDLVKHELGQKRLRSYYNEADLIANLTSLYRSSRTAMEENGANTLYIGLGFLKWYENPSSEVARYAPILLLPVEIIRKSARQGFVIRGRDEEPMINITLLEKLRQDFGITISGLETLPRDESGVDVPLIFNVIRRAVMTKARWDVEPQVLLGTFSFSKFILWNDIHNNSKQLLQNKVIASLVSGKLEWQTDTNDNTYEDDTYNISSIALPISVDSSQLDAIISSGAGKSFVLHGPPGTGKSQTITNIIANAVFAGKKVLFVAAKKAALDVVESRLEQIGIGAFCLELHSNKSKKTEVIAQLKRAAETVKQVRKPEFEMEAAKLKTLKVDLNDYVHVLHKKWRFGFSLYGAFNLYSQLSASGASVSFPNATIEALDEEKIFSWNNIVSEIAIVLPIVGIPNAHPLKEMVIAQYTPQFKEELTVALRESINCLNKLEGTTKRLAQLLCIDKTIQTQADTALLAALARAMLELPDMPGSLFGIINSDKAVTHMKNLTQHAGRHNVLEKELQRYSDNDIMLIDAETILREWNSIALKWFLPRWAGHRRIHKLLNNATGKTLQVKEYIPVILQKILTLKAEQRILDDNNEFRSAAGFLWQNEQSLWQPLNDACNMIMQVNAAAEQLAGGTMESWRQKMVEAMGRHSKAYKEKTRSDIEALLQLQKDVTRNMAEVARLIPGFTPKGNAAEQFWTKPVTDIYERWMNNLNALKDWASWIKLVKVATEIGLAPLVAQLDNGTLTADKVVAVCSRSVYEHCANYIIGKSSLLSEFNSRLFEEKIVRFRRINDQFEQVTKAELFARLSTRIPDFSHEASQSSEIGLLQKAIRSNGRGVSIRKLFDTIPNLLPRLMPCMLMSPISVAQYFDASAAKFDIVIFDEASQLPTCEAVGAIARGTSLIVVGDPKQMPPTNFFGTANIDEDNIDKEDLESILDDCLALSMPSKHLLWHYRSKHESLIAFSNAKYYDNKLLTFPSTDDMATKVTAVHVPGFYDKGKTRQNRAEARAIVAEIIQRLSQPLLARRSIGVVTFSQVQQTLIEDLLNEEFRKQPELEQMALASTEPLFIKNLENVQGDERDVILFSICYGPDEARKISINFGPLNREGGWRRLNVAVSRARYEMKVFSTLRADEIDLARTSSEGVAGLKAFLAYAEKGKIALPNKSIVSVNQQGLEAVIANAIRARGYDAHVNIGCSGYKIDIGVVDPADPSKYLLGVITDGHNYNAAKTARDREVLQENVLKLLGWKLHKVWSMDWWEKREKVIEGIIDAIKIAETVGDEKVDIAEMLTPAEVLSPVTSMNTIDQAQPLIFESMVRYMAFYPTTVKNASTELFLSPHNRTAIAAQINQVANVEFPISKSLLYKRILSAWGISRAGSRITAHLDIIIREGKLREQTYGTQVFLWREHQLAEHYTLFRIAGDIDKRDAEELPPEEIANAIKYILTRQLSLPKADLTKEVAKLFGFSRTGNKVEEAVVRGIEIAIHRGSVLAQDDRIVLIE